MRKPTKRAFLLNKHIYWLVCFCVLLVGYVILANKATKKEHEFVDQNYINCFTPPHVLALHVFFRDISPIIMLLKENFTTKDTVWGRIEIWDINAVKL
jgi:hypothetical protein